ncbi:hypothetical protein HRR78_003379 [Exophiala dermatitidis]|nr:hypothetical protein HRR75_000824 [Exophiala dermatitidis]KAJ4553120.1 hypothetical protein HRR78_003379 [Exophiala dermatitidis]
MSTSPAVTSPKPALSTSNNLLICTACGAQYDVEEKNAATLSECRICEDPRQFIPETGQSFTTLANLRASDNKYRNVFEPCASGQNENVLEVWTEPKVRYSIDEAARDRNTLILGLSFVSSALDNEHV